MLNNKILIIDDEPVVTESIREDLSDEGYEILSTINGKEGLALYEKELPIVIILDLKMPVMDGLEFLRQIKLKPSDPCSIIVMTGHGDDEDIKKCFELGISAFINKPYNDYVLRGLIKNSVELKQKEDELKKYQDYLEELVEGRTLELNEAYTELKSSQVTIIHQEKMASIGQLAAGVVHEINNPVGFISSNLRSLRGYVEKLTEFANEIVSVIKTIDAEEIVKNIEEKRKKLKIDYVLGDIKTLVKESIDGTDRVKKIVQDIKNFSRSNGEELLPANINECIESTLNIVWNELKYKATVKKEYGEIPLTKCSSQQLSQVFMNLLVNATHAINKQGVIEIKTWHKEDYIFVAMSDTGCGIPQENLEKIFEPFFTTKEVGKGTGLGMSISSEIIKKHNGELEVDSKVGEGTTFRIKIPVVN